MEKLENALYAVLYTAGVRQQILTEMFTEKPALTDLLFTHTLRSYGLVKNFFFENAEEFSKTVNLSFLLAKDVEVKDAVGRLKSAGTDVALDLLMKPSVDHVIRDIEVTQLGLVRSFLTDNDWPMDLIKYYQLLDNPVSDKLTFLPELLQAYKAKSSVEKIGLPYKIYFDSESGAENVLNLRTTEDLFKNVGAELPVEKEEEIEVVDTPVEFTDAAERVPTAEPIPVVASEQDHGVLLESAKEDKLVLLAGLEEPAPSVHCPQDAVKPLTVGAPLCKPQGELTGKEKESVLSDLALNSSVIYVDCDNTNFFIFLAFLRRIEKIRTKRSPMLTIKMYSDLRSHPFWSVVTRMFKSIKYTMELRPVEFIKSEKSVVDMAIAVAATKDVMRGVRSLAIMSSDSDYFGVVKELGEDADITVAYIAEFASGAYLRALYNAKIPHCDLTSLLQEGSLQQEADRIIRTFTLTKFAGTAMNRWNRDIMVGVVKRELQFGQGTEYAAYFEQSRVEAAVDATLASLEVVNKSGKLVLQANGDAIELEVDAKGVC